MTQAGVYEIRVVGLDGSPPRVIHAGKARCSPSRSPGHRTAGRCWPPSSAKPAPRRSPWCLCRTPRRGSSRLSPERTGRWSRRPSRPTGGTSRSTSGERRSSPMRRLRGLGHRRSYDAAGAACGPRQTPRMVPGRPVHPVHERSRRHHRRVAAPRGRWQAKGVPELVKKDIGRITPMGFRARRLVLLQRWHGRPRRLRGDRRSCLGRSWYRLGSCRSASSGRT